MNKKDSVAVVPKYRFPEFALDASIDYVAGGFLFDPITNRNHHADLPILAITHVVIDDSLLHYVVITKVKGDTVVVFDPAKGIAKGSNVTFNY